VLAARLRLARLSEDGGGCAPPEELRALEADMQASVAVRLRFQGRRRTRTGRQAAPHPTSALAQCCGPGDVVPEDGGHELRHEAASRAGVGGGRGGASLPSTCEVVLVAALPLHAPCRIRSWGAWGRAWPPRPRSGSVGTAEEGGPTSEVHPPFPSTSAPWFTRRSARERKREGAEKERWGMRGGRRWCWQMGLACHWEENEIYVFVYACSWARLVFIRISWHIWGKLKIVMANFKIRE
jgi:hypothetical protein